MRPTAFDVLVYMFEHYDELPDDAPLNADASVQSAADTPDDDPLEQALVSEGFDQHAINGAFQWLDELAGQVDPAGDQSRGYELAVGANSIRVLAPQERQWVSEECLNFLLYLQSANIISAAQRELILERAFALALSEMTLEQFQWISLMVLANQPDEEEACVWLEELLFDRNNGLPN